MLNACLESALFFCRNGMSVIPIDSVSKKPLIEWKEFQTKCADEARIKAWWSSWPNAGVGVVTGKISGIIVVDTEEKADLNLFGLKAINTPTVRTGGGGKHFYFAYQEGIRNSVRFAPLHDIRSDGGYVLVPPSDHKSGNKYQWFIPWGTVEPLPFPPNILSVINKDEAPKDWGKKLNEAIGEGERNQTAASVCGKLVLRFREVEWQEQAWPLLVAWNAEHAKPPLSNKELRTIFDSICNAEKRRKKTGSEIGEPSVSEKEGIFTVAIPVTDGMACFQFEDIERTGHDMDALVHCFVDLPGAPQKMFTQKLGISSSSSRDGYVRALRSSFDKEIPWALVLSQACTALQSYIQEHTEEQVMTDILPEETSYLLYPYIEENAPNIIFGMGGTGKTFLCLRLAVSFACGVPFLAQPCYRQGKTLFIDYESTAANFTHRVSMLLSGLSSEIVPDGVESNFVYLNPKGTPIHELVKQIKKIIQKHGIKLVIIDSAALACGGQPEEAGTAIRFFNALAKLNITTLTIAHETKAENKSYPFGSVFFHNSARNIWNAQVARDDESGDTITTGLFHRKSNNGRLVKGRTAAKIVFGQGEISIGSYDTAQFPEEKKNKTKEYLEFLRSNGWKTTKEIADFFGEKPDSVYATLHRKIGVAVVTVGNKWDVIR